MEAQKVQFGKSSVPCNKTCTTLNSFKETSTLHLTFKRFAGFEQHRELWCVLKGSYRILTHVASRENIPHTARAATAQAICDDELPEESTSSRTACHSPGRSVRIPLVCVVLSAV